MSPLKVAAGQMIVGALAMAPVALAVDQPWLDAWPPLEAWAAIAAVALFATALGYVLYFRLIDSAGATNALLSTLLVPPTAILLGALFLDERLTPAKLLGVLIAFAGVAVMIGPDLLLGGDGVLPQLACLAAAFCYAIAGVWARRF